MDTSIFGHRYIHIWENLRHLIWDGGSIFTKEDGKLLVKHGDLPEECIREVVLVQLTLVWIWVLWRNHLTCTKQICYSMNLEEALSLLNPALEGATFVLQLSTAWRPKTKSWREETARPREVLGWKHALESRRRRGTIYSILGNKTRDLPYMGVHREGSNSARAPPSTVLKKEGPSRLRSL